VTDSKTVVEDLAAWLTAIWDEEERIAKAVKPLGEVVVMGGERHPETFGHSRHTVASEDGYPRTLSDPEARAHFALHEPASVLARIAADRKILRRCMQISSEHEEGGPLNGLVRAVDAGLIVHDMADRYRDRPDFPEWLVERQGVEG
jgi:hypothetical protein